MMRILEKEGERWLAFCFSTRLSTQPRKQGC
jgi:hypothetical protein